MTPILATARRLGAARAALARARRLAVAARHMRLTSLAERFEAQLGARAAAVAGLARDLAALRTDTPRRTPALVIGNDPGTVALGLAWAGFDVRVVTLKSDAASVVRAAGFGVATASGRPPKPTAKKPNPLDPDAVVFTALSAWVGARPYVVVTVVGEPPAQRPAAVWRGPERLTAAVIEALGATPTEHAMLLHGDWWHGAAREHLKTHGPGVVRALFGTTMVGTRLEATDGSANGYALVARASAQAAGSVTSPPPIAVPRWELSAHERALYAAGIPPLWPFYEAGATSPKLLARAIPPWVAFAWAAPRAAAHRWVATPTPGYSAWTAEAKGAAWGAAGSDGHRPTRKGAWSMTPQGSSSAASTVSPMWLTTAPV